MDLYVFQNKILLLLNYVDKLQKENIPVTAQRILLRVYANDLRINLTNNMIFEILTRKSALYAACQFH